MGEVMRVKGLTNSNKEEGTMKKTVIPIMVVILTALGSVVMADQNWDGEAGRLFLFQKCDSTLIGKPNHDSSGCPNIGIGPWPIFSGNGRVGVLHYNLWGKNFEFSFHGRNLLPNKSYTLIYYPDPWPGNGLICLGTGQTTPSENQNPKNRHSRNVPPGNIEIHGSLNIGTSLPASYDANFNPISPSGAVGAKIWLVLSDDVQCKTTPTQMTNWDPTAYLFEYNLIVYENQDIGEDVEED
jgi:hypothetical protein